MHIENERAHVINGNKTTLNHFDEKQNEKYENQ